MVCPCIGRSRQEPADKTIPAHGVELDHVESRIPGTTARLSDLTYCFPYFPLAQFPGYHRRQTPTQHGDRRRADGIIARPVRGAIQLNTRFGAILMYAFYEPLDFQDVAIVVNGWDVILPWATF